MANGYPRWQAGSGNLYCDEGSHWDITSYTCTARDSASSAVPGWRAADTMPSVSVEANNAHV